MRPVSIQYGNELEEISSMAWSPDGTLLISSSANELLKLWEVGTGRRLWVMSNIARKITALAWSPDGKYIAVGAKESYVQVLKLDSSNILEHFFYYQHTKTINDVAWSPDGKYIASGSRDKTVQIWEILPENQQLSQKHILTYQNNEIVQHIQWSPDGKHLAIINDNMTVTLLTTLFN